MLSTPNHLQDLAVHTRVTPEQRKCTMSKFMQSVNGNPVAKAELEKWGLILENSIIQVNIDETGGY